MRVSRVALIALASVVVSVGAARPVSAAPWQLCLTLNQPTEGAHAYFLNFLSEGNAILASGSKGHGPDNHGPAFGALAKPASSTLYELGLTVTFQNGGDYTGPNTENVVFQFLPNGVINYKRWLSSGLDFTQGQAFAFACPAA
jgi:hypothetical protein